MHGEEKQAEVDLRGSAHRGTLELGWSHDVNASKKEGFGPSDECGLVSNDDIDVPSSAGICLTCQAWRRGAV